MPVWGTTWYAISWQIADVAPEVGEAMRFALAGTLVLEGFRPGLLTLVGAALALAGSVTMLRRGAAARG